MVTVLTLGGSQPVVGCHMDRYLDRHHLFTLTNSTETISGLASMIACAAESGVLIGQMKETELPLVNVIETLMFRSHLHCLG